MRARTLRVSTIGDRSVQASLRRPLPLIVSEPAVTEAMSAGVADSGNTVIGRRPRRSSLSIVPIALLDVCTASLRVLRWACLGTGLFFVTEPRWQVIQSRLSMTCRCRELSNVYRSGNRGQSRVREGFQDCLHDFIQDLRRSHSPGPARVHRDHRAKHDNRIPAGRLWATMIGVGW